MATYKVHFPDQWVKVESENEAEAEFDAREEVECDEIECGDEEE